MTTLQLAILGVALVLAVLLIVSRRRALGQLGLNAADDPIMPLGLPSAGLPSEHADAGRPARSAAALSSRAMVDLHELEVSDVMVHRTDMRSLNADDPPGSILRAAVQSPHTRMPLWRGSLDNIVGVLHARDLLRALSDADFDFTRIDPARIAIKPWFVPDTTRLDDQLDAFLRRKMHFAIVVDEYGEVEGLITLEDILEEIVGDIADEHDVDVQGVRQETDGSIVVDGSVPIRDLNRALGWALPDEEATTIAGLVIHEAQSIPDEKQSFTFHGKRFIVMNREKNRITRIRIRPADGPPGGAAATRPAMREPAPAPDDPSNPMPSE